MEKSRRRLRFVSFLIVGLFLAGIVTYWCVPGNRYYLLNRAIWNSPLLVVRVLVAIGADVDGADYDVNITPWEPDAPLMLAVMKQDPELTEFLLHSGAKVDFLWGEGYSPLWFAVHRGNCRISQILIEHGANPDFPTWMEGPTPRKLAALKNATEILGIMKEAQPGATDNPGDAQRF